MPKDAMVPCHWKEAERMRLARQCQPTHGAGLRRNGRDKTWQGDKGPGELPEFGRMAGSVPLPQFGRIRPCRCRAGPQYHRRDYGWAFGLPENFGSGISGFGYFGFPKILPEIS